MFIWSKKNSTYYDRGSRPYEVGDEIPDAVILEMGKETVNEYEKNGWISEDDLEKERLALLEKANGLGLKPHYKLGIEKLNILIDDFNALEDLKKEALEFGIDPSDDVTFAELTILVEEKKANESDS